VIALTHVWGQNLQTVTLKYRHFKIVYSVSFFLTEYSHLEAAFHLYTRDCRQARIVLSEQQAGYRPKTRSTYNLRHWRHTCAL